MVSLAKCGFTLKSVYDKARTYSQMHCTDKFSQHGSVPWPVWINGCLFVYELSGCGFEPSCGHLHILMFDQIFFSRQVKRCAIITYEGGIKELPHELPNDLRTFRKLRKIRKMSSGQILCESKSFVNTRKKLLKDRN